MKHPVPNLKPGIRPVSRQWLSGVTLMGVLLALSPGLVQSQTVYRIVGPDGKVTFSDKPPATAAKVTGQEPTGNTVPASGSTLPYELRQIADKYPVTLYTSKDCAPCDSGRNLLRGRGVPFAEKTIASMEDSEALQRLSGATSLPFLTLGGQQIKGYSDSEWSQYLSAAGYPEKSKLPAAYRNPAPTPLVAVKAVETPDPAAAASTPTASPKPAAPVAPPSRVNPANPTGIQF